MTDNQINLLIKCGELPEHQVCQELIQTHISWVIVCQDYVYKLKKPLKLSFLDFSTLEKRKHYCEQELVLNQRLTNDIYLDVLPVRENQQAISIRSSTGKIIDYALVMRKLDNSREMDKLLLENKVTRQHIRKIARQLVNFHRNTDVVRGHLTADLIIEDFNDIQQIQPFIVENLGEAAATQFKNIISYATNFINANSDLITNREMDGFVRDCHGDLHSGNIFLPEDPVIFDCIEFNEHLRKIDIQAELGFFCMDLEFYQRSDLSEYFMQCYLQAFQVIRNKQEEQLFLFYKMYRANVKAKINAIRTQQAHNEEEKKSRLALFEKYYQLFLNYYGQLNKSRKWLNGH